MRNGEHRGTWLCPSPFDRTRLLDMEARLGPARMIMYGALAIAFAFAGPLMGYWPLVPLVVCVLTYRVLEPRIATADRPEYVVATSVVVAQLMIGIGVALTGGATSPALIVLLLPIVTLPARFGTRGVQAGVALTIAIILAATLGTDPGALVDNPQYVIVSAAALFGLAAFSNTLMRAEVEQRSTSSQDPLTGLLNRKALGAHFEEIARQAALSGRSVCMVLLDVDHFKAVNDRHGHSRGDAVLRDAAEIMRANLRSFELVYRLGGEEFLVVMPGVDRQGGRVVAERLREALERARPGGVEITASFGVGMAVGSAVAFEPLFDATDQALYRAKAEGRNRTVLAPELRPGAEVLPTGAPSASPGRRRSVSLAR